MRRESAAHLLTSHLTSMNAACVRCGGHHHSREVFTVFALLIIAAAAVAIVPPVCI
jgi:hypothetical protein